MGAALLSKPETIRDILTTLVQKAPKSLTVTCKIRILHSVSCWSERDSLRSLSFETCTKAGTWDHMLDVQSNFHITSYKGGTSKKVSYRQSLCVKIEETIETKNSWTGIWNKSVITRVRYLECTLYGSLTVQVMSLAHSKSTIKI